MTGAPGAAAEKPGTPREKQPDPKPVWKSNMNFMRDTMGVTPMSTQGSGVAASLAARLQKDGFFPGCVLTEPAADSAPGL